MDEKLKWYDKHGVEEYYFIDPYDNQLLGWTRRGERLEPVYPMKGFVSPRLGVRFEVNGEIRLFAPDGREFRTREERVEEIQEELRKTALAFEDERTRAIQAEQLAREVEARAEHEAARAEHEAARAEHERGAKERLAAKLRELGVNPDDVLKPAG